MKLSRIKDKGFIRLEELGGGRCRYAAGWRAGHVLIRGEMFDETIEPRSKLVYLRAIGRQLDRTPKPL